MLFGVFGPWLILVHGTCELTRVIPLFVLDWEAWTFKLMHRVGQSLKPHALTLSIKWTEKETQAGSQNVNEEWGGVNFLVQNWPSFFLLNTRNFEVVTNSDRYPPLMVGRRSGLLLEWSLNIRSFFGGYVLHHDTKYLERVNERLYLSYLSSVAAKVVGMW